MVIKEDRLRVTLSDMAPQGDAIARFDDRVVFAACGIPGEEAIIEVRRGKGRYLSGQVVEVISPSPHRTEPRCQYFARCTGCQWQHIDYRLQLAFKRRTVERQLALRGNFAAPPVLATMPADEPWHYRNHARFSVDSEGHLGFVHKDSRQHIRIDFCHLMHPWINSVLDQLQGKCAGSHQVAVRYGVRTGEGLIQPRLESAHIALESGQPFYHEQLLGHRFRISASSFFQVNTLQAERLAVVVLDRLHPSGDELIIDAYAGVGTFASLVAPQVKRVIAIEEATSAVKDSAVNMAGMDNVELVAGKAEELLPLLGKADAAIIDPPRVGCHPRAIASLLRLSPPRIIYVSCEPRTLAWDLRALCAGGYRLLEVQPIDMFPHTYHVECVATLVREEGFSPDLILASASPRRRELLLTLGLCFEAVAPPEVEVTSAVAQEPGAMAERLALAKALETAKGAAAKTVVAADTLVVHQGMIMGKPRDAEEAQGMLRRLRGEEHLVVTGLAVLGGGRSITSHTTTKVAMRPYSDDEISAYIASGEAWDKAGAYGIQDLPFDPAARVEGCYLNVVGLPLCALVQSLAEVGLRLRSRPLWALPAHCQGCPLRGTLSGEERGLH